MFLKEFQRAFPGEFGGLGVVSRRRIVMKAVLFASYMKLSNFLLFSLRAAS
jgi:hypothetical protein